MRTVIQRCKSANVEISGSKISEISTGLVILLGVSTTDTEEDINYLVEKICNIRVFPEGDKEFDKSILDKNYQILLVSQFTLYANTSSGRRPDFINAAKSDQAKPLYEMFIKKLSEKGIDVKTGEFGAEMQVSLINDGPVTLIIESPQKQSSN